MSVTILDGPSKSVAYPERRFGWTIVELRAIPELVVISHDDLKRLERIAESIETIRDNCTAILKETPQ